MFRLFVLLHLSFITLFACQAAEKICHKKLLDSQKKSSKHLSIPIYNNQRVLYSLTPPEAKILKHDPFLGLYLVADSSDFSYDFTLSHQPKLPLFSVSLKGAKATEIVSQQLGLNRLASLSTELISDSIITNSCCDLEAIVTQRGVIQKEYLKRFFSDKDVAYGDVGARFAQIRGDLVVFSIDPFFENNLLKKGDKLLAINGKRLSATDAMQKILFAKIGTQMTLQIERDAQELELTIRVEKRHGGGELSDTFLERKGVFFDDRLYILHLSSEGKKLGLNPGDRLLQINGERVDTQGKLRLFFTTYKEHVSLLFKRNNFEFFINIR